MENMQCLNCSRFNIVMWRGIVNRSDARKDMLHCHTIEKKVNAYRFDSRIYSIATVTQGMIHYYLSRGPIHLQNWAHALMNCYPLWEN